jgi:cysteine desulfurase family protein (TIGR01976 family)
MKLDVPYVRRQFPALARTVDGHPVAYFDCPGGTQVPQRVADAVTDYLLGHNSNTHGFFASTIETDHILADARDALADFLGCDWDEVAFGANTTTLNFLLAHSLVRDLREGDEIVLTEIDHEANRGPWISLQDRGVVLREAPVDPATCTLDWDAFERLVNERTRIVATVWASNAVGTINDVARVVELARSVGALTVIDAVHYALHGVIDVAALGCDFLLCSAYKFFAPHVGVLYARREAAELVRPLRLRTQLHETPFKFETGTLNHEGIAGAAAAVDFIADLGRHHLRRVAADAELGPRLEGLPGRRRRIVAGMLAAEAHEQPLARRLIEGLRDISGVTVYGPPDGHPRTSTVAFTVDGMRPEEVCRRLGREGLFLWDGHFYAIRLVERLGLIDDGGLVRAGLAPYTAPREVERLLAAVRRLAPGGRGAAGTAGRRPTRPAAEA